jgi:hypothetical protein
MNRNKAHHVKKQSIDLTIQLSAQNFQAIVKFILENGNRKTYCNKYNNSPHYLLETFHIYLNPITQFINYSETALSNEPSDYNEIVIHHAEMDMAYFHLILRENNVFLENHYEKDFDVFKKTFLLHYLPRIKGIY